MSVTAMTNVPMLLEMSNNSVSGAMLFGVLVPDVEKPLHFDYIQPASKARDIPVLIDLIGIEVNGVKGFARGQVFALVNKSIVDGAKKKKSGRLGVVLTGGSLKLSHNTGDDFVSFLKWGKNGNVWHIGSVNVFPLQGKDFPDFFKVLADGYNQNWNYTYPCKIDKSYRDASAGYNFQLLDGSVFDKDKGLTPALQVSNMQSVAKASQSVTTPAPAWNPTTPDIPQVSDGFFKPTQESLGGSSESNISDISRNLGNTYSAQKVKPKEKVQSRDKFVKPSKNFGIMEDKLDEANEKVETITDYLETLSKDDVEMLDGEDKDGEKVEIPSSKMLLEAMTFTINQLHNYWGRNMGDFTGRALFKQACEMVLSEKHSTKNAFGVSTLDTALDLHGSHILSFLTCASDVPRAKPLEEKQYEQFYVELSLGTFSLYYQMLDILLGTGERLSCIQNFGSEVRLSIPKILEKNPYMLCFIDPRFTIEELDKIAMYTGADMHSIEIIRTRNVAYMHNFMLDSSNRVIGDNTVVRLSELRRGVKAGYLISSASYNTLQADGTLIKQARIESLQTFFNPTVQPEKFVLSPNNWNKRGIRYHQEVRGVNTDSMIQDFIKSGLGVHLQLNGVEYLSDYVFARKEVYLYKRLYELSQQKVRDISDKDIQKCLESFEDLKTKEFGLSEPFKLEQRQADALKLIRNPVMCLTGPAGSGKTTTAEALVYGAETLLGFSEDEVMFCAPTGKAANRLKEVVKRKTRTINSLFGIGGDSVSLKDPKEIRKKDKLRLLVVDESSMPNINLLYEMITRIDDYTHIYFLGDIEQLPPIGFGKPFANMLQFLPTVALNVSKRASENSGISLNAKRIIDESDGVIEDLVEKPDFRILHTKQIEEGVRHILNICKYHLGVTSTPVNFTPVDNMGTDVNPDDIQVITPINKYAWGTKELNNRLQDIFNPIKPRETYLSYARGVNDTIQFRKGDRVIHVKSNQSERVRLILKDDDSFGEAPDSGINNGEQGKIVGFYRPSKLRFTAKDGEEDKALKDAFGGKDETMIYIAVQFKDTDADTGEPYNFVILYRADITMDSGYQVNIISRDLQNLDLAYALTTHKLQGSEAKLVIAIFFQVGQGGFISRNMLYTAESRGKKAEYFIGDVLGRDSAVNKGRRIEQTSKRVSMLDMF